MFQVFSAVVFVPVHTRPGPELVTTTYRMESGTSFERKPVAPCGRLRLVMLPEPAIAPVYLMTAKAPTLTAARLMVFVPFKVSVPQLTIGTAGLFAVVGVSAITAPKTEAPPMKDCLLCT